MSRSTFAQFRLRRGSPAQGALIRLSLLTLPLLAAGCSMSGTGHNLDGVRNFQAGSHYEAIQDFQQALASDSQNSDAYYNLAATYYEVGRRNRDQSLLSQAEGLYHQCLDIDPNHTDCHRGLASLLVDTNRQDSAFTLLQRWNERSPQLAAPKIELARLNEEFGRTELAMRYLTDALNTDATDARAWTAMGRLREQQGQLAQALSNYQQAYNINSFQPGVADRIASLQQQVGTSTGGTQIVTSPWRTPIR